MNYRNRNTLRVLHLQGSACFQQFETYQRRSPAVRDTRFDRRSNRDLAANLLAECQEKNEHTRHIYLM